jgi:hypothetical protein
MSVAIDIRANARAKDRRGRIFVTDIKQVQPALIEALSARFIEEDDLEREPLLEELLRTTLIVAWVYPGIEPDDIAQVYLQPLGGGERLFACTVVPRTRLEQMLAETPAVIEGFSLQVVDTTRLSTEVVGAAISAWAERNYPAVPAPAISVEHWKSDIDLTSTPFESTALVQAENGNPRYIERDPEHLTIGSRLMPREAVA